MENLLNIPIIPPNDKSQCFC